MKTDARYQAPASRVEALHAAGKTMLFVMALVWMGCGGSSSPSAPPPMATPTPAPSPSPTPPPSTTPTPRPVALSQIQASIFSPGCANSVCHGGSSPQQGMSLEAGRTYGNIVNVASNEVSSLLRVRPGDPDSSYLVRKLEGSSGIQGERMPPGGPFLSAAQIQMVRDWITAGAPNN